MKDRAVKERDIEAALVSAVKSRCGEIRKVKWIGRRGAPDRVVFVNGETVWVELKRPGGKLTVAQQREHKILRAAGQTVTVIYSLFGLVCFLGDLDFNKLIRENYR